ncbi:MAG: deoxyribodipyrimidine photo-lyase [Simkaniaceae bacterium]|nr:deoxyribodipyrimidine photo-lyase [Simkaniaceae bacterium]
MLVFWHQEDLRIEENLGLSKACAENPHVVPIFILSDAAQLGEASRWWLHKSLEALQKEYAAKGVKLILRRGDPLKIFKELNVQKVFWNQTFSEEERLVAQELGEKGRPFNGNHLVEIPHFFNKLGNPFAVFTPFYKTLLKEMKPVKIQQIDLKKGQEIESDSLDSLKLLPKKNWTKSLERQWMPGRKGALKRLHTFTGKNYGKQRDFPAEKGTSLLSPHLHFGELSPYEVWAKVDNEPFRRQLAWREFGSSFVTHFPKTTTENWQAKFDRFPWKPNAGSLRRWQKGETGYPIVDAGMRQLWKEGWMHNRVRMIVASFLVKDLFIHWKEGAAWFWDTLVDADMGNNTLGWQWVAGSGPDAAPFFRIFNPILQGEKFDPMGHYVKMYCPALKNLSSKWVHKPWLASEEILRQGGVDLGETYPYPMVDHKKMRDKALAYFEKL